MRAVSVVPNGLRAVVVGFDEKVRVWDLDSGEQVGKPLEGHEGKVYAVSVTRDGRYAVTGGKDGTVRVWDLGSGECLTVCDLRCSVLNLTAAGAPARLVCGLADGRVAALTMYGIPLGPPIVTPTRVWLFGYPQGTEGDPPTALGTRYDPVRERHGRSRTCEPPVAPGAWDKGLTVLCPICGTRSPTLEPPPAPNDVVRCPSCTNILVYTPFVCDLSGDDPNPPPGE
ncbi:MAG: hypothetical protein HY719_15180 [Planctomycetes bacterium]|nr:hypothetical protein [Planctomycetota bacterium]